MVQGPNRLAPDRHPEAAKERRDWVLGRMEELGWAKPAEVAAAKKTPIRLKPSDPRPPLGRHAVAWSRRAGPPGSRRLAGPGPRRGGRDHPRPAAPGGRRRGGRRRPRAAARGLPQPARGAARGGPGHPRRPDRRGARLRRRRPAARQRARPRPRRPPPARLGDQAAGAARSLRELRQPEAGQPGHPPARREAAGDSCRRGRGSRRTTTATSAARSRCARPCATRSTCLSCGSASTAASDDDRRPPPHGRPQDPRQPAAFAGARRASKPRRSSWPPPTPRWRAAANGRSRCPSARLEKPGGRMLDPVRPKDLAGGQRGVGLAGARIAARRRPLRHGAGGRPRATSSRPRPRPAPARTSATPGWPASPATW